MPRDECPAWISEQLLKDTKFIHQLNKGILSQIWLHGEAILGNSSPVNCAWDLISAFVL